MGLKIIEQYSIWWVDLEKNNIKGHEQYGKRPFLVISKTEYNVRSKTPIGFIGSSSEHKYKNKYTIPIDLGGDKKYSHVNFSQIITLSEERFIEVIKNADKQFGIEIFDKFKENLIG